MGDRYILKLFRDYVFHSVGVDGKPILDLSHVLVCLNKVRLTFFFFPHLCNPSILGRKKKTHTDLLNHSWTPVWTKGSCSSHGMIKVVLSLAIEKLSIVLRLLSSEFYNHQFKPVWPHSSAFIQTAHSELKNAGNNHRVHR